MPAGRIKDSNLAAFSNTCTQRGWIRRSAPSSSAVNTYKRPSGPSRTSRIRCPSSLSIGSRRSSSQQSLNTMRWICPVRGTPPSRRRRRTRSAASVESGCRVQRPKQSGHNRFASLGGQEPWTPHARRLERVYKERVAQRRFRKDVMFRIRGGIASPSNGSTRKPVSNARCEPDAVRTGRVFC